MFGWLKKKQDKQIACNHPGISFSLENDTPRHMRCHFCKRVKVTYDTGIAILGTNHTRHESFWVEPDWKLEQAIKTSPREFGDLRIEKWLRLGGYI